MNTDEVSLLKVSDQEEFLKNYKAAYNAMTAKPDCKSRLYTEDVIISLSDIYALNDRIFEKFRNQYDNIGFSVNVIVSLKGRKKLEFSTWVSFEEYKWLETEAITDMMLIWEFNVKLPKYQIPQRHRLVVKLSNGIRPEEMLNLVIAGRLEEVNGIDQEMCPIAARMDFIDPVIGGEVLDIVSNWVKGLKRSENVKTMNFLQKNKRKVAYFLNYMTVIIALICSLNIVNNYILSSTIDTIGALPIRQFCDILSLIFYCGIGCFVLNKLSELLAKAIFRILSDYGDHHIFNITKGDQEKQSELRRKQNKDGKKVIWNLFITIFINILCGIFTYFVTKGM